MQGAVGFAVRNFLCLKSLHKTQRCSSQLFVQQVFQFMHCVLHCSQCLPFFTTLCWTWETTFEKKKKLHEKRAKERKRKKEKRSWLQQENRRNSRLRGSVCTVILQNGYALKQGWISFTPDAHGARQRVQMRLQVLPFPGMAHCCCLLFYFSSKMYGRLFGFPMTGTHTPPKLSTPQ